MTNDRCPLANINLKLMDCRMISASFEVYIYTFIYSFSIWSDGPHNNSRYEQWSNLNVVCIPLCYWVFPECRLRPLGSFPDVCNWADNSGALNMRVMVSRVPPSRMLYSYSCLSLYLQGTSCWHLAPVYQAWGRDCFSNSTPRVTFLRNHRVTFPG